MDEGEAAYRWLLDQGTEPGHIAFAGDSVGGWLAITVQLRARARGLPLPAAALLMSPVSDLEVSGESYDTNSGTDPLFHRDFVRELMRGFLGPAGDPRDPLASPLHADLTGLAPVYIQVGGDETLLDDARSLDEHARKAGARHHARRLPRHAAHLPDGGPAPRRRRRHPQDGRLAPPPPTASEPICTPRWSGARIKLPRRHSPHDCVDAMTGPARLA